MKREPKHLLVKFFRSFTTEVIKNIIGMLSHFISWDGWLYMGPGRVRFQGEVEVSFDSRISCTWRVVVSPYLRHLFFILGKLSKYFLSFVFVIQLQPKTCRVFRERYMNDRSRNSHGKQLNLTNAKFRAVDSKPTLFITKFRWTFVSKRNFAELSFRSENSTK